MEEEHIRALEALNLKRPKNACCKPAEIKQADMEMLRLLDRFEKPQADLEVS